MAEQWQPWKWKAPESSAEDMLKQSRQDGQERVSGQAVYTRDISLPEMLYAKILTSPYAHSKILSMETSKAEALAGTPFQNRRLSGIPQGLLAGAPQAESVRDGERQRHG